MGKAGIAKNIISVAAAILVINTMQVYLLYQTKKFGDINFFNIQDHIFGLLLCFISFGCTFFAWRFVTVKYNNKVIRIGLTFLLALLLFYLVSSLFFVLYRYLAFGYATTLWMMVGNIVFGVTMHHLYISGYTIAYLHFTGAKKLAVAVERLEKEKEIFKSRTIQKSLEPHFLFNNLSVLSSLIKSNPTEAGHFIDDFSDVYRYYLKYSKQDLVYLHEEIEFVQSYIALLQKRFKGAYTVITNIQDDNRFIIPTALQLCIENTVKHNYASADFPLKIYIEQQEEYITVRNETRPVERVSGSGIGNEYLKKQYKLQLNSDLTFTNTGTEYIVKIPLIT